MATEERGEINSINSEEHCFVIYSLFLPIRVGKRRVNRSTQ